MIFLNCKTEEVVQVADKTRIDVSGSFVSSGDAITDILITPEVGADQVSVFSNKYLDYAYATDGDKTIAVEATDGTNTVSQNFTITVVTEEDDNLYSTDAQIFQIESELSKYIPPGRNSYKNIHREAQARILSYLDRKRIWKESGDAYGKNDINNSGELQKWSLYEAIYMIYTDLYLSVGDKFAEKMNQYRLLRDSERDRGAIRIDAAGTIDDRIQDMKSYRMIRR